MPKGAVALRSWVWALVIGAAVVIGGAALVTGVLTGRGEERRPRVDMSSPTEEERELQKIKVAASVGELVEATRVLDGWVVRVMHRSQILERRKLEETTVRFFRELERAGVAIAESSFEVRTDELKDVWGNRLPNTPIFRVAFGRESFQRVNWKGIAPENLERVSDDYWVHDVILQKEQQSQSGQGGGSGGDGQNSLQGGGGGQDQ